MKKSVILLILAVYILSVCIVGFFGIQTRIYNPTINVESVEITDIKYNEQTLEKQYIQGPDGQIYEQIAVRNVEKATFKVYYDLKPSNATNKDVILSYDQSTVGVTVKPVEGVPAFYVTIDLGEKRKKTNLAVKVVSTGGTAQIESDVIVLSVSRK